MCGIAGVVDVEGVAAAVVDQLGFLRHRGPDSHGIYERGRGHVGQTRLAIIDLVTGDPPIASEDGAVGVAFNGEIYNFRRLQHALRLSGHTLKTDCDTEVIAHLAEDLSPVELCRSLDGMFAFAVWDSSHERLVCGRDRFGKKPFHYWTDGRRFVFGSEIKAVLADSDVPRRIRESAIADYLTFGYVPTPDTFFEGVHSLPPGCALVFEPGHGVHIEEYWRPTVPGVGATPFEGSFEEAAREVRRLLCDAVDKRLVADVPLGAFLSGGVDSSSVVAFMARLSPRPVRTFTIGFEDEQGFDERPFARAVASLFSTDHTEFVVNPDKAELIERLVWHHDQPFGDSSALPTFLLSELTKRHVTVALCGDGGDELFGGYERFAAALATDRFQRAPSAIRSLVRRAGEAIPPSAGRAASVRRLLDRAELPLPDAFLGWINYIPTEWRSRLLDSAGGDGAAEMYRTVWRRSERARLLDRLLLLNIETYLVDDLLPKVDRMAMAHGLEVRSPMLDTALSEFALRLPPSYKIRGLSLKRVLKAAVADLLPSDILRRPKRGFGIPLDRWFRTDLRTFVEGMLGDDGARVRSLLRPEAIDGILSEHLAGRASHGHSLWTLLTLEVFLRAEGL